MGAAYVDTGDILATLDDSLPEGARLAAAASSGDVSLNLGVPGDAFPIGSIIAVGHRGATPELVTVDATTNDGVHLASALHQNHAEQSRVLDVTVFPALAEAASRFVDLVTRGAPGWLAYEPTVVEDLYATVDADGNLPVLVSKRVVTAISGFGYHSDPALPSFSVPVQNVWVDVPTYRVKAYLRTFAAPSQVWYPDTGQRLRVGITYSGGYWFPNMGTKTDPSIPDAPIDLRRNTAALAVRLWKEKDSGFSDVIGGMDAAGTFAYKRAIPSDIKTMLSPYIRVGV